MAHSAVLMLVDTADQLVLTHRNRSMRAHAGQMAFPGGRADPEDRDVSATALREAQEEVGLRPETVDVVDVWEPVSTVSVRDSSHPVFPVLARWRQPHPLRVASPQEVERVLLAPLAQLADPTNRLLVGWGAQYRGPAFWLDGYLVWGMTAGLVDSLLTRLGYQRPWDHSTVYDVGEQVRASRNGESWGRQRKEPTT